MQHPPFKPTEIAEPDEKVDFKTALDSTPVLIWMAGLGTGITYVNLAWLEFTGRTLEQELGDGWLANVHPDDMAAVEAGRRAMAARQTFHSEFRLRRADGAWRWLLDKGEPRRTPTGDFAGYIGSAVDITDRKNTEAALRSSEERLKLAQEAASVGTYDWDIVNDRITWSPEMFRLHGIDPATAPEDVYAAWLERLHPEDRQRAHDQTLGFVDSADRLSIEFRIVRPDGSIGWIEGRGRMVRDNEGRPLRMVGANFDITEQRQAEQAARETEQRLGDIAENFPGIIFQRVTDPAGGIRYTYFSRPDDAVFGISRQRLQAVKTMEDMVQLIHFEDFEAMVAKFRHAAETLSPLEIEGRVVGDDGAISWVRSISRPRRRPDGALVWDGVLLDVTDQHRREGERERAATMLHMSMEVAGVGTWEFDPQTQTIIGSPVTNAVFAIEGSEPRPFDDYLAAVHPDDVDFVRRGMIASAEDKTGTAREYRVVAADGSIRWIASRGNYVRLADGSERVIGALFETTERKRREEEREAALGHQKVLLKELNHRIKNNLQMITSVLRLQARRIPVPASAEQFFRAIERIEMIGDLQAQLGQETGVGEIEFGAYLQTFCQKVRQSLLDESPIELRCQAASCILNLDQAVPLGLIVNELVTNSIKYAFGEGESGVITVSLHRPDERRLQLSVSDSGRGMPPASPNGEGLGLQLVQGLCRQIGAEFEVAAAPGASFVITVASGQA